jgi:hypothetical protein
MSRPQAHDSAEIVPFSSPLALSSLSSSSPTRPKRHPAHVGAADWPKTFISNTRHVSHGLKHQQPEQPKPQPEFGSNDFL